MRGKGKKSVKWSAYTSEKEDFKFARQFHNHEEKTLEAELMDWADDAADTLSTISKIFIVAMRYLGSGSSMKKTKLFNAL